MSAGKLRSTREVSKNDIVWCLKGLDLQLASGRIDRESYITKRTDEVVACAERIVAYVGYFRVDSCLGDTNKPKQEHYIHVTIYNQSSL